MNEVAEIFPILFLVYALQCVIAVPARAAVFWLNRNLKGHLPSCSLLLGSRRVFFCNPFTPLTGPVCVYARPAGGCEPKTRFSLKRLDKRLADYARETRFLHPFCVSMFVFLFFVAPALTYLLGFRRLWLPFLIYTVFLSFSIVSLFNRSHKRIYGTGPSARVQQLLTIALSPFAAIRANDALTVELFADFHPLTVARRLLSSDEFLKFASSELRRAAFSPSQDALLVESMTSFLRTENVDPAGLLRPPIPDGPKSRSYCPVCLAQYVAAAGECLDCPSVMLRPLTISEATSTEVSERSFESTTRNVERNRKGV